MAAKRNDENESGKLTTAQKRFIVERLALDDGPSEVAEDFKETFGFEITRQRIHFYDPRTSQGNRELGKEWREIFERVHTKYLAGVGDVPILNKIRRGRVLDRLLRTQLAKQNINPVLVMQILKAAREEMPSKPGGDDALTPDGFDNANPEAAERASVLTELLDDIRTRRDREVAAKRAASADAAQGGAGGDP